jgi:hypothetical protein
MATVGFIIAALLFIFALVLLACSRSPRWDEIMIVHDGNESGPEKHIYKHIKDEDDDGDKFY